MCGGRKGIQKNGNGRVQNDLPPMWIGFVVLPGADKGQFYYLVHIDLS
jgi:hypothetical protein